jgi:hypothetical protein
MRDVLIVLLIALIIVVGGWKFWSYQQSLNGENVAPSADDSLATEGTSTESGAATDNSSAAEDVVGSAEQPITSSSSSQIINIISPKPEVNTETSAGVGASVSVSDQNAGDKVEVKEVVLPAAGWVVIRDYKDGKMGNTLGAKLLDAGTSSDVVVELLRKTVSGSSYLAVPLKDNGDGVYKGADDLPFNDASGKPVMTVFKAN